jgi:hypothetical protein
VLEIDARSHWLMYTSKSGLKILGYVTCGWRLTCRGWPYPLLAVYLVGWAALWSPPTSPLRFALCFANIRALGCLITNKEPLPSLEVPPPPLPISFRLTQPKPNPNPSPRTQPALPSPVSHLQSRAWFWVRKTRTLLRTLQYMMSPPLTPRDEAARSTSLLMQILTP